MPQAGREGSHKSEEGGIEMNHVGMYSPARRHYTLIGYAWFVVGPKCKSDISHFSYIIIIIIRARVFDFLHFKTQFFRTPVVAVLAWGTHPASDIRRFYHSGSQ